MDCPIYSAVDAEGLTLEVFPRFFRVSTAAGDILAEYGAAHVRRLDAGMIPADKLPPGGIPRGTLILDRYGDLKPSKGLPIPFGVSPDMDGGALRNAILAMKPANVAHMQKSDNGCGPAVVATLRGISYAQAVEELYKGRGVRVLGTQRLAAATRTTCRRSGAETLAEAINAGAVAALIRRDGAKWGHYVAIERGGVVVDPELILKYPLAEYPRRGWLVVAWFVAE